jgi:hypothetical protein
LSDFSAIFSVKWIVEQLAFLCLLLGWRRYDRKASLFPAFFVLPAKSNNKVLFYFFLRQQSVDIFTINKL